MIESEPSLSYVEALRLANPSEHRSLCEWVLKTGADIVSSVDLGTTRRLISIERTDQHLYTCRLPLKRQSETPKQ